MNWLKSTLENFLSKGFKITIKKEWQTDKDLNRIHPANVERTDAMDDISTGLNKKYICSICGKKKKQNYILKCVKCNKYTCSSCYTIINKKAWCKECLKTKK